MEQTLCKEDIKELIKEILEKKVAKGEEKEELKPWYPLIYDSIKDFYVERIRILKNSWE